MSDFIVIAFDNTQEADRALTELVRPGQEHPLEPEDAVVAKRGTDGKLDLTRHGDLAAAGVCSDEFQVAMWGALVALPFLSPLVGMVTGAALDSSSGAISGKPDANRIKDEFIRSIGETLPYNTSALFILVHEAQVETVMAGILSHFRGHVIRSSLSPGQEAHLNAALSGGAVVMPETAKAAGDAAAIKPIPDRPLGPLGIR